MFFVWGTPAFVISFIVMWLIVSALVNIGPKCPYCKGKVNRGATKCVHCGSDVIPAPLNTLEKISKTEISKRTATAIVVLIFCPLLLLLFLIGTIAPISGISVIDRIAYFLLAFLMFVASTWAVKQVKKPLVTIGNDSPKKTP